MASTPAPCRVKSFARARPPDFNLLAVKDPPVAGFLTASGFGVAEMGVEGQVFGHFFVGVKFDGGEAPAPGGLLGEGQQFTADPPARPLGKTATLSTCR